MGQTVNSKKCSSGALKASFCSFKNSDFMVARSFHSSWNLVGSGFDYGRLKLLRFHQTKCASNAISVFDHHFICFWSNQPRVQIPLIIWEEERNYNYLYFYLLMSWISTLASFQFHICVWTCFCSKMFVWSSPFSYLLPQRRCFLAHSI